jgi:hypothetical protein
MNLSNIILQKATKYCFIIEINIIEPLDLKIVLKIVLKIDLNSNF